MISFDVKLNVSMFFAKNNCLFFYLIAYIYKLITSYFQNLLSVLINIKL